ncbi:ATP-dependent caseinolytic (Clp) protease/crotonase family protein [Trifolium repens]|nr:ATP-dependent caseinolytic (Clp) protease/crotonase family protein [Trifolium repens]
MVARLKRLYDLWEENSDIGFVLMKVRLSVLVLMLLGCITRSMKIMMHCLFKLYISSSKLTITKADLALYLKFWHLDLIIMYNGDLYTVKESIELIDY